MASIKRQTLRESKPVPARTRRRKEITGWRLFLPSWRMVPALFALLITAGLFFGAVYGLFRPDAADFGNRHVAAREAGDWKEAVLWLRRQLAADPAALEPRMNLIEAYASLGDTRAVGDLLNQIAPGDRVIYGPAHLYRARRIAAGGLGQPDVRVQAGVCLDLALKADAAKGQGTVDQDAAHGLLAEVLAAGGDWQGALAAAEKVATSSPADRMLKATVLKNLGRIPEASAAADEAVRAAGSGDSLEDRLRRASIQVQASFVKNESDQAVDAALAAGHEPAFKVLQATTILRVVQGLRAGGGSDSERWLEIVLRGLVALPEDSGLTTKLIEGSGQWLSQPGFGGRMNRRLRDAGLEAHLELFAAIASLRGNLPDEASDRFKHAWELLPGNPVLANNHAAMLGARPKDADPAGALEIIEGVLINHPDVSSFLDTKGQLLLRLGRIQESVGVLEAALKGAPGRGTHAAPTRHPRGTRRGLLPARASRACRKPPAACRAEIRPWRTTPRWDQPGLPQTIHHALHR